MKIKSLITASLLGLTNFTLAQTSHPLASTPDFSTYFKEKSACFIVFNLDENKLTTKYNPSRCEEKIPPDSTFKIALSLMAFDQKIINQNTVFKWDGQDRSLSFWNQDQTPKTWLKNSAVWVSQQLTPQLGLDKIKYYLEQFDYGNQDFSGGPGKNNGLTHAWLSSSLKISGNEQLVFLKKLIMNKLPVSKSAMTDTKENMYLETSPNDWKLYGKTGTGSPTHQSINHTRALEDGWFIGYVEKGKQTYLFVLNFSDSKPPNSTEAGGTRAKKITKALLTKMNLF